MAIFREILYQVLGRVAVSNFRSLQIPLPKAALVIVLFQTTQCNRLISILD
jgi:hypothetical protein